MNVWLPVSDSSARPLPAPTIAYRSRLTASKITKSLAAVSDQIVPKSSNDQTSTYYHWWPEKNKWEWIEYDFERPEIISHSEVYWFDDGPDGGCRIPDEWKILYKSGNGWAPVKATVPYKITKDGWDSVSFMPVRTSAVRIMVKMKADFSSGVHEWAVE